MQNWDIRPLSKCLRVAGRKGVGEKGPSHWKQVPGEKEPELEDPLSEEWSTRHAENRE